METNSSGSTILYRWLEFIALRKCLSVIILDTTVIQTPLRLRLKYHCYFQDNPGSLVCIWTQLAMSKVHLSIDLMQVVPSTPSGLFKASAFQRKNGQGMLENITDKRGYEIPFSLRCPFWGFALTSFPERWSILWLRRAARAENIWEFTKWKTDRTATQQQVSGELRTGQILDVGPGVEVSSTKNDTNPLENLLLVVNCFGQALETYSWEGFPLPFLFILGVSCLRKPQSCNFRTLHSSLLISIMAHPPYLKSYMGVDPH